MKDDFRRRSKSASAIPDVRLAVTGGPRVGKSAISVRFLTKRFIGEYQRSFERIYRRNMLFGNDVIDYDLKDAADTIDHSNVVNWATCIAVIYSITDRTSFALASTVLDEIDTILTLREPKYQVLDPCLALIGNKKDLDHFREIKFQEGKTLAKKHGAGFWEASASDDYTSIYKPLNSLIIESYLNVVTAKNTNSNSNSLAPIEVKPRARSEISLSSDRKSVDANRCSIDSELEDFEQRRNFFKRQEEEAMKAVNNQPTVKDIRKRKKLNQEIKRQQLDLRLDDKHLLKKKGYDSERSSLDEQNEETDAFATDVPFNSFNELAPISEQPRSNSWSKREKKNRLSQRRSNEAKSPAKLMKSKSYSDFKSFSNEQNDERTSFTHIKTLSEELDKNKLYKQETLNSNNNNNNNLMEPSHLLLPGATKPMVSSFTRLSSLDSSQRPATALKPKKERRKTVSSSPVDENGNLFVPEKPEERISPAKMKRNEHKKSVRRKLSSIFRPKVVIEST